MKNFMMIVMASVVGLATPVQAGSIDPDGVIYPDVYVCPEGRRYCRTPEERIVDPVRTYAHRTTCSEARKLLRHRGFHDIEVQRCGRSSHVFTGWRLGSIYRIKVSARTGRVISAEAFLLEPLRDQ